MLCSESVHDGFRAEPPGSDIFCHYGFLLLSSVYTEATGHVNSKRARMLCCPSIVTVNESEWGCDT